MVKNIRRDFEQLYSTLHREMTAHYNTQMEELKTEIEQTTHYQSTETEVFSSSEQTLQIEYEQMQKSYASEKETSMRLEAGCCKSSINF